MSDDTPRIGLAGHLRFFLHGRAALNCRQIKAACDVAIARMGLPGVGFAEVIGREAAEAKGRTRRRRRTRDEIEDDRELEGRDEA